MAGSRLLETFSANLVVGFGRHPGATPATPAPSFPHGERHPLPTARCSRSRLLTVAAAASSAGSPRPARCAAYRQGPPVDLHVHQTRVGLGRVGAVRREEVRRRDRVGPCGRITLVVHPHQSTFGSVRRIAEPGGGVAESHPGLRRPTCISPATGPFRTRPVATAPASTHGVGAQETRSVPASRAPGDGSPFALGPVLVVTQRHHALGAAQQLIGSVGQVRDAAT